MAAQPRNDTFVVLIHFVLQGVRDGSSGESSSDEVLFRSPEDYRRAYNCYVLALLKSGSSSFADAIMSNHVHFCLTTDRLKEFCYAFRVGYGKYFNHKYRRKGELSGSKFFLLEVDGLHHILAALSYVFRNALHHGVAHTPFDYPYCSANAIFRKELGKESVTDLLPKNQIWKYLPKNTDIEIPYRMDRYGMFLREEVTEVKQVELLYGTPRKFLYHMNRLSGEKWDSATVHPPPITIGTIETSPQDSIADMLKNELYSTL